MLKGMSKIHFVGIGGTGMSGIAKVLHALGKTVSGSDLQVSDVTHRLEELGIKVFFGHAAENIAGADLVVVSSAIPATNPEVMAARDAGVRVWQRAEMLAAIMRRQRGIAIAGAHGKTTTTSMIALVLEKSGLDPTVVIGGELNDIGGNAKLGHGEYLVAEADESDGSFLKLGPEIVVVTNVENDHLDYYGDVEHIVAAFHTFLHNIPLNGLAVVCADDQNIRRLLPTLDKPYLTFGLKEKAS